MNEVQTRAEHIKPALKATRWGVVEGKPRTARAWHRAGTLARRRGAVKRGTADIADYVLVYRNTPLAVVEGKAWDKPAFSGIYMRPRTTWPL